MIKTARYKCDACGNLTRFDVVETCKTKSFYHYSLGGELTVEEEQILDRRLEEVVCRWCGHGRQIVTIDPDLNL